jgi:flagellum-specific ATP synthase
MDSSASEQCELESNTAWLAASSGTRNPKMHTVTRSQLNEVMTASLAGSVVETVGMTASVADFPAPVGAVVRIERDAEAAAEGEVVGFRDGLTLVYLLSASAGVRRGNCVRLVRTSGALRVGAGLLGRVIDSRGRSIDGRPQPMLADRVGRDRLPPPPVERPRIRMPLATGVQAIDCLLTCGRGQRLGIFSGSGVGKSVLLGMMSRYTNADVIVTGLIGERGREVNEFLERDLGADGLARSVVVVATSNEPALARVHAASTATAVAEYFRDQGKHVLLLMDSVTRFAMAQREIGLAAGEPPTTRGYPPSTFALLPRLVERAGQNQHGSITAFYSVLVEGDDETEPVADAMRGLLDGHVWLSRKLAGRGHYPAIDVLASIQPIDEGHYRSRTPGRRLDDSPAPGRVRRSRRPAVDRCLPARKQSNGRRGRRHAGRDRWATAAGRRSRTTVRESGGAVGRPGRPVPVEDECLGDGNTRAGHHRSRRAGGRERRVR